MANEFDKYSDIPADKGDETVAQLESKIEAMEVRLNETKFCYFIVALILLDVIFFAHLGDNWAGSISILVLEIILLIIVGRHLDVRDVEMLTNRIIHSISARPKK